MYKLTIYIPETHLEQVKDALFAAGAGQYQNYDRCCWQVRGEGQFRPLPGSQPFLGEEQKEEHLQEYRVEMLCAEELMHAVAAALKAAHPYEEPAFDFIKIVGH
ncbi:MAG: NGG1p interacting factor NIF3 [Kiritimatiellae bacterium]|nr:NGG1p interacting factor NIF3 [Kiritimatiellia bacterium]